MQGFKEGSALNVSITYLSSPIGLLRLQGLAGTLLRIDFAEKESGDVVNEHDLSKAVHQIQEYFSGSRISFDFSMHAAGTHFQQNVWEEVMNLPYGKTSSYEELARRLGDVKVIRAAASANGRNPLPIVIPCHRIIGKDGSLTGYSGGIWRKKWLLDFEQRITQPKLL